MAREPSSIPEMKSAILAQPHYVFNPGAPVARDLALSCYNQPYLQHINVRRVLVIDADRRAVLLTTPFRVMAAWRARRHGERAPYLSVSGWQPAIPPADAQRFLSVLSAARTGSLVIAAGRASWYAVNVSNISLEPSSDSTAPDSQDAATLQPEHVQMPMSLNDVGWLRMVSENLTGVDVGTCYVTDQLDFELPDDMVDTSSAMLLIREEETEVAMGAPMLTTATADEPAVDGVQFRGGYGARWDPSASSVSLRFPYYSPKHRPPSLNRVWNFASPLAE